MQRILQFFAWLWNQLFRPSESTRASKPPSRAAESTAGAEPDGYLDLAEPELIDDLLTDNEIVLATDEEEQLPRGGASGVFQPQPQPAPSVPPAPISASIPPQQALQPTPGSEKPSEGMVPPPAPTPAPIVPPAKPITPLPAKKTEEKSEAVQFTVFHPKESPAEVWHTLLVYAHLESVLAQIQVDATKFAPEMANNPRKVTPRQTVQLARGTELRIVPSAEGVTFKPNDLTLRWDEDYERALFRFRASADYAEQAINGEIAVYMGLIEIATIKFSIFITDTPATTTPVAEAQSDPLPILLDNPLANAKMSHVTATIYNKIFISYSRKDTEVAQAYRLAQLAAGHEVFLDTESIRTGEDWQAALAKAIDSADVFQLFWSEHAASSPNVRDEWDYALKYKCPDTHCADFVRPVFWRKPMPTPPTELGHLNFKYVPLQGDDE